MLGSCETLSKYYESGDPAPLKRLLLKTSIVGIDSPPPQNGKDGDIAPFDTPCGPTSRTPEWLRAKRIERNLMQKSLAEAVSAAANSIANIEQGQRKGSDALWSKIKRFFER